MLQMSENIYIQVQIISYYSFLHWDLFVKQQQTGINAGNLI